MYIYSYLLLVKGLLPPGENAIAVNNNNNNNYFFLISDRVLNRTNPPSHVQNKRKP